MATPANPGSTKPTRKRTPITSQPVPLTKAVVRDHVRAMVIGKSSGGTSAAKTRARTTSDSQDINTGLPTSVVKPPWELIDWRNIDSDRNLLETMKENELMRFVFDVSPEANRALHDNLRYANAGFEITALKVDSESEDPRAKKAINEFRKALRKRHGSEDVIYNRLFMNALIGGAFFAELITDQSGTLPLDIATPDPRTVRFRRKNDTVYGQGYELGQLGRGNQFVSLDGVETVRYLPNDPWPGDPYGRSPFTPILFPALTLLGVLRDARRVLQQAGFPQRDVSVDYDMLVEAMPRDPDAMEGDPIDAEMLKAWIAEAIEEIGIEIDNLPQDGTFIHTSLVTVKLAEGALGENALSGLDAVVKVLERMLARGAKSNALLMLLSEGDNEASANRQWETYAKWISALQHPAEAILEEMYSLALQAQGLVADVKVRFAMVRASDEYRRAQTMQLNVENYTNARDQGWVTQDEAAQEVIGHSAVAEAPLPVDTTVDIGDDEPAAPNLSDEGTEGPERMVSLAADRLFAHIKRRLDVGVRFVPVGADAPLGDIPDATDLSLADERTARAEWDSAMADVNADGLLAAPVVADEEVAA
jgi:hypothetical protein